MRFPPVLSRLYRLIGSPFSKKRAPVLRHVNNLKKFVDYAPSQVPAPQAFERGKMKITWIIPDFVPGAGGHMTIFRLASYLERFGHEVRFLIQNPSVHKTGDHAKERINTHFQPFSGKVELFTGTTPEVTGDALIATDRFTCYPVNAMGGFIRKFYLVQDFEPAFYPSGAEALLTEATYHFDFDCLCAGEWLHERMSRDYGRWSMSWPLAYDAGVYNTGRADVQRSRKRIAVYARFVTPRRAVELAFMALDLLKKRGLDFEVDFFGWDLGELDVAYPYRNHGVLNGGQLADLYREATIGVVFSATNHSLVNKEMMACGLPVIDLDRENVRAIFPDDCMCFAQPTPQGIADAMERLFRDPQEQDRLRAAGMAYVQDFSWEKSARLVEAAIAGRLEHALSQKGG
ncbi:glycosyltransferase family 4 protein [Allorhizobium undicola]|uniref:glycosyltransferase family 4 protein n=1 Tax=Allorhizobium undicola TaxID=78527 RepID=UPI003D330B59